MEGSLSLRGANAPRHARARWLAVTAGMDLPSLPEKFLQQRRGLVFTDRGIDLRHMMAGRGGKKAHAGIDRAALGIGGAVIEPANPRERDRPGAHRARLERDIEVAIDQPFGT